MKATATDLGPGVYAGSTWVRPEHYHASKRISRSQLVRILKSPAHFKAYDPKPTRAMLRGDAIHCAVLEPERFAEEYVFPPMGIDRRTKAGRDEWDAFLSEARGRTIVGWDGRALWQEDATIVHAIQKNVGENPDLASILHGAGYTEATIAWDRDGVELRCRPDRMYQTDDGWIMADLKSTADNSPHGFASSVARHLYHLQAAMYLDGAREELNGGRWRFLFVAYETVPPYTARTYFLDDAALQLGDELYTAALKRYRECVASDEWPDLAGRVETLQLPAWAWYD